MLLLAPDQPINLHESQSGLFEILFVTFRPPVVSIRELCRLLHLSECVCSATTPVAEPRPSNFICSLIQPELPKLPRACKCIYAVSPSMGLSFSGLRPALRPNCFDSYPACKVKPNLQLCSSDHDRLQKKTTSLPPKSLF